MYSDTQILGEAGGLAWLLQLHTHQVQRESFNLQEYCKNLCTNGPSLGKIFFSLSILWYTICYLNVSRSSEVHHIISTTESAVERPAWPDKPVSTTGLTCWAGLSCAGSCPRQPQTGSKFCSHESTNNYSDLMRGAYPLPLVAREMLVVRLQHLQRQYRALVLRLRGNLQGGANTT